MAASALYSIVKSVYGGTSTVVGAIMGARKKEMEEQEELERIKRLKELQEEDEQQDELYSS